MKKYADEIVIETDEVDGFNFLLPEEPADTDPNFIKHVRCEGARFHIISWDSSGKHCSHPKCIINKRSKSVNIVPETLSIKSFGSLAMLDKMCPDWWNDDK